MRLVVFLLLLIASPVWAANYPTCDQLPNHACLSQDETVTGTWTFSSAGTTPCTYWQGTLDTGAICYDSSLYEFRPNEDWRMPENRLLYMGGSSGSGYWAFKYDEATDDQLLLSTTKTATATITDPLYQILVGGTPTADQQVFGIAKGTQASNVDLMTLDEDGDFATTSFVSTSGVAYIGDGTSATGIIYFDTTDSGTVAEGSIYTYCPTASNCNMYFAVNSGEDALTPFMQIDTSAGSSILKMGNPGTASVNIDESGRLSFSSGSFLVPTGVVNPSAAGAVALNTNVGDMLNGDALIWEDSANVDRYIVDLDTIPTGAPQDDYVVAYDSADDGFYLKADVDTNPDGCSGCIAEAEIANDAITSAKIGAGVIVPADVYSAYTLTSPPPFAAVSRCWWGNTGIVCEGGGILDDLEVMLEFTNPTADRIYTFGDAGADTTICYGNGVGCAVDDDVPEAADYGNLTGGAGIVNSPTGTIATASLEAGFVSTSALTCTAHAGAISVISDVINYCESDGVGTKYAALGNSSGESTAAANNSVALGTDTTGLYVNAATTGGGLTVTGSDDAGTAGMTVGTNTGDNTHEVKVWIDDGTPAWENRHLTSDLPVSGADTYSISVASTFSEFGVSVDDTEMTAEDFGDFTCTGLEDGCTVNTDTVATLTANQVLTAKTLTAPTIADFTNAAHDHGDTNDAGPVALGATSTGTTASANDDDTSIATTAFVQQEEHGLVFSHTSNTAYTITDVCLGDLQACVCTSSSIPFQCQLIVPKNCTLRNLYAETDVAIASGSWVITVVTMPQGSDTVSSTSITCTIDNSNRYCSDTTHTQAVTAGQKMQVFWDATSATSSKPNWSLICD